MSQLNKNHLIIAAFLMDGLRDAASRDGNSLSSILEAWGAGYVELVDAMTDHVEFIEACFHAGNEAADGCPGVFDYEVSSEIGQWMANEIIANGDLPTKKDIEDEIVRRAAAFFSSGLTEEEGGRVLAAIEKERDRDLAPSPRMG